jgi:hypothetical protein
MAKDLDDLTADELEALSKKKRAAEKAGKPVSAHSLNVSVDLGDPDQVKLARKLGFLSAEEEEKAEEEEEATDDDDEKPARGGYFKD